MLHRRLGLRPSLSAWMCGAIAVLAFAASAVSAQEGRELPDPAAPREQPQRSGEPATGPDQEPPAEPPDEPGEQASPGGEPQPGEAVPQEAPPETLPEAAPQEIPPAAIPDIPPDAGAPPDAGVPPDAGAAGTGGPDGTAGAAGSATYFNPSIAVVGNFLAVAGDENPNEDLPSASLRESEVSLQAIVDPYGKADFFLAFGEEGVELEEGFITFTALPADLLLKVGRMRAFFGKVNTLHLHTLPWPDEPLPVVNLLGSDEGWIGTGASVARLIPLPADTFSELTLQVFRGEAEGLFEEDERSDLAWNGHYRLFRDLTEATNLDLGVSYGFGPNGTGPGAETRLAALDATLRWKPLQTGRYRSFTARGELFRAEREQPGPDPGAAEGWFVSGDYQLARRWTMGARVESAEHPGDPDGPAARDRGLAALLTFAPSEFSLLRGELRRREYADGSTADELLMQLQFAIGAHGAHPF